MIATARAGATASINSSFLTMGKIAEQALPLVRNVIEAIIYAVFPFVFLLFLLAQGRGLGLAIKSFVMSLIWIQLWPPLYAILNYVATLASARNLEAAARMGAAAQGLALETAGSIYHGAVSDQAIAGYLVISIPIIATAIIKGGEVAFQAVTGVGLMQSAASAEASAASKGNVTQDAVSMDQQQLAPNRTSAFMTTASDAHGTAIRGIGTDAGVFRYQATLSRLATTFTFTERQATALTESAREAESFARSEREAMQRSQAAALTQALGIQEGFERSQQRSGASTMSDGGSTSTQIQTLNSVAKEVNRRLGLSNDSTVGKSVAAMASAGASIPLTEIGGRVAREGRRADQEQIQSAYDYARKAIETAQLAEATALVKEFRNSDAYQWAQASRTGASTALDSSYRETLERQSAAEQAYSQSKELARVAQFMREWSSGAQTDFTNYAAHRLAERGLLREDDPIRLQRAVSDIAYACARGGDIGSGYVAAESPLGPYRPLPDLLGWTLPSPRAEFRSDTVMKESAAVRDQAAANDAAVRKRHALSGITPAQAVSGDLQNIVRTQVDGASRATDQQRHEILTRQGVLARDHNAAVSADAVSDHHGSNRAVWDTVGVQSDNRAALGRPPVKQEVGTWHFDQDGTPVAAPTRSDGGTADPSIQGKQPQGNRQ